MDRLKDKVVLVAGAGGRQGTTVPLVFAREGAKLALAELDQDELDRIARRVRDGGGEAVVRGSDLSDADDAEAAVRMTIEAFGRIDVLYNNTGIYTAWESRTGDTDLNQWHQLLEVNLESHFLMCKYALREMVRQKSGAIINIAAARAARLGGNVGYAASKAAIIALTRILARELGPDGITVNTVAPGRIDTDRLRSIYGDSGPPASDLENVPARRLGTPAEIAAVVAFLASDGAGYVTGAVIPVDGGLTRGLL